MKLLKNEWGARPIPHSIAKDFVIKHHYGHGCGNTGKAFGLFYKSDLRTLHGVAMWQPPAYGAALHAYPLNPKGVCSLSRFCLRGDRPENAGSFLISKSIKMLDTKKGEKYNMLITYADLAFNHSGGLYRACNWIYNGLTRQRHVYWEEKNGKRVMVSKKRGPNTYTHQEMLDMGYKTEGKFSMHRFFYPIMRKHLNKESDLSFTSTGRIQINKKS